MSASTRTLLLALCVSITTPAFAANPAPAPTNAPAPAAALDIRGHVADAAGKAIADAEVWLCRVSGRLAAASIAAQAKSADDGSFAFPAPATAKGISYAVVARDKAHGVNFVTLAGPEALKADLAITLTTPATAQATVTDTAGHPVADAQVFLVLAAPKGAGQSARQLSLPTDVGIFTARSDAQGKVQLTVPADCTANLVARKPGFADAQGTDKLVLCPGANITGTVTFSDGTPAPNMLVSYLYAGGRGRLESFALTDAAGHYDLKDVAGQGYYRADAPPDDGDPFFSNVGHLTAGPTGAEEPDSDTCVTQTIDVKPNATLTKNLVAPKLYDLSGTVVEATTGKPIPGAQVHINAYSSSGGRSLANRSLTTDKEGRFVTSVLRGASVNLNLVPPASLLIDDSAQPMTYQNLQNVRSDTKDLTFRLKLIPTRRLAGRLVGPDGKGLAGTVYSDPRLSPVSTADGSFTLAQAPADRPFAICAIAGGLGGITTIKPDQNELVFTLQPLVERELTFVTASGTPVPDLAITCFPAADRVNWYQAQVTGTQTDAAGKTRLKGLIAGATYNLTWNSSGNANIGQGNTTFKAAAELTKVTVKEYTHTITGKVVNSKGEPIANARLQCQDYANAMFRASDWGRMNSVTTSADGSFRIEHVADGILEGEIYGGNYRQLRFCIPAKGGEVKLVMHTQQEPAKYEVLVCDEQGTPLADTPVMIVYRQDNTGKTLQETSTTDSDGMVDLGGINSQQGITVICDKEDSNLAAVSLQSYREGRHRLVVNPSLPSRQVRVVDDAGKPLAGIDVRVNSFGTPGVGENAQLYMWPQELMAATGMVQKTDATGRAVLPRVSHKQYVSLNLSSSTYGDQSKDIQPTDSDAAMEIRLSVPGKVTGKVALPAGAKVDLTKYHVQLIPTQGGRVYQENVRADGTYTVSMVVPGAYKVSVQTWERDTPFRKYRQAAVSPLTIETSKTTTLDLALTEGIRVRGRLEYKRAANASGNAQVYLHDEATGYLQNYPTDADGNFELYVPSPGEYRLMCNVPGGDNTLRQLPPIQVPTTQPVDNLVLKAPQK